MEVESIQKELADFAKERDWDQFHNPKNLVMALSAEAGELVEIFQWLDPDQALEAKTEGKLRTSVEEEIADVLIYTLRLADKLNVDLEAAVSRKLEQNRAKYPVEQSRGNAKKYTEFDK